MTLVIAAALVVAQTARFDFVAAPGADAVARALAAGAETDRDSIARDLGRDFPGRTEVRVATDPAAFRALQPPERRAPGWARGVAYPDLNLAVLQAAPGADPRATLRHELSHLAVGRLAQHRVPRWFLEGLATVQSGDLWRANGPALDRAALLGALPTLEAMIEGFPPDGPGAELAYAMSAGVVAHLLELGGPGRLDALVRRLVAGDRFEPAFHATYGASTRAMERAYIEELLRGGLWIRVLTDPDLLWGACALLFLYAWYRVRRRRRLRLEKMGVEEELAALRGEPEGGEPGPAPPAATLH